MKIGVLVHPQLGLLCGAALPGAFFLRETFFLEKLASLTSKLSRELREDIDKM